MHLNCNFLRRLRRRDKPLRTPVINEPADDGNALPAFLAEGTDEAAEYSVAAE